LSLHVEFVLAGPPISNQQSTPKGRANLSIWRDGVFKEAAKTWSQPPLRNNLKAVIINFHQESKPSLDTDNMSKPILDALQELVYEDDRQIRQAELSHVIIDAPMVVAGASRMLVNAIWEGRQFVYVRIEDAIDPLPLPR
jgi:crossover junction endodeoxyribonuclease RusA